MLAILYKNMLPIINSITIDRKLQSCFELVMPKIHDKGCVLEDQVSLLRTVLIEVHLMRFAMFFQTGDLAPAKVLAEVLVIGVVIKVMLQGAPARSAQGSQPRNQVVSNKSMTKVIDNRFNRKLNRFQWKIYQNWKKMY